MAAGLLGYEAARNRLGEMQAAERFGYKPRFRASAVIVCSIKERRFTMIGPETLTPLRC